jgi:glycine cleavage system T protein (aminomethyltransferase)
MPSPPPSYGDPAREHAAVRTASGIVDRTDFGLLEVTGRDRATFLHAMLSNDVASLAPGQGCAATLLDVHGKVQVLLRVLVLDDRLLVITPPDLAGKTNEALDAYLFSEKAYFRDVSGEQAMYVVAGPDAPSVTRVLTSTLPEDRAWSHVAGAIGGAGVRVVRGGGETGEPELWLMTAIADAPAVWDAARAAGATPVGRAAFESLRIEAGTPSFPDDMGPSVLLPEVPFADLVSSTKGCYIGQEVVVRIRDRGHVNRMLRGLVLEGASLPTPGAAVVAGEGEIGTITSAAWSHALKRPIALGLVRRQHAAAGTPVTVRMAGGTVAARVADLPVVPTSGRAGSAP